jgi:hypothetical protein
MPWRLFALGGPVSPKDRLPLRSGGDDCFGMRARTRFIASQPLSKDAVKGSWRQGLEKPVQNWSFGSHAALLDNKSPQLRCLAR